MHEILCGHGEVVYHFRTCTNIYTYTHCIAQTATKSSVTELLSVDEKRWLPQTLMSSHLFLDFYIYTQKKRMWGRPILKLAVDVFDPLLQYTDSQTNEAKLFITSHCEYAKIDFTTAGQLYIVFILPPLYCGN